MRKVAFSLTFLLLLFFLSSTDIQARKGGDANSDGNVNVADAVFIAHYVYRGGPPPTPLTYGDFNGDFEVNELDVVHAIAYLYRKGELPATPLEILEISLTSPHSADGIDSSEITITASDSLQNPVIGAPFDVLLYIGEDPGGDLPPVFPVTDNGDGTYTSRVASTTAGEGVIAVELVSLNLVSLSPITVTFEPGPVTSLTIVDVEQPREEKPRETGRIVAVAVDSFQNPVHPPEANILFESTLGIVDVTFDESGDFIGWITSPMPGRAEVYVTVEYTDYSEIVDLVFPAVHLFPPIRSDTTWTDSTWLKRDTTGYLDIGLNVWNPHPGVDLGYYDLLISFDPTVIGFLGADDWDATDGFGPPNIQEQDPGNIRIWQTGVGGNSNDLARLVFEPLSWNVSTPITVNLSDNDPNSLRCTSGLPIYTIEDWWSFSELEYYEIEEDSTKPPKWVSIKLWVAPGADANSLADQIGKAYALFRSHAAKCCPMMYEHILFNYIPDSTWDSLTGDNDSLDTRAERDSARARFDSSGYVDVIGAPDNALPGWSGVAVAGDAVIVDGDATATGTTMAHELGHYWGLSGHNDPDGNPWGKDNLMHATSNPNKGKKQCAGLTAEQCSTITANADP